MNAIATPLDQARTAYAQGRFVEAAELAEAMGTSESYALGAASLTAYGRFVITNDDDKVMIFERAIELANKAIESDPNNADAHLQLTRALGRYTRNIGRIRALNENIVERTREHLETALSIDEQSASLHHSMGRWHVGLTARMGSIAANLMFGGNKKDAAFHFNRALQLGPKDKEVYYGIAIGMLALSKRKYRETAQDLLQKAIELPIQDAYGQFIDDLAVARLAKLIDTGK